MVNKNVLNITLFHYPIPYDKECKAVENIVVSHLHLASFKIKWNINRAFINSFYIIRRETNLIKISSTHLPPPFFFAAACTYNLFDILCNHLMFYYVYMPLRGPFNLDQYNLVSCIEFSLTVCGRSPPNTLR